VATNEIIEKILSKAREKGEEDFKIAQQKYEELLKQKENELKTEYAERLEAEKKRIAEKHQQKISALRLMEKNKLQALKRSLLNKLYDEAWDIAVSDKYYSDYLERELKNNAEKGDSIIISVREQSFFEKKYKNLLAKYNVRIAEEKGKFKAGFIIPRGSVRLNCTLDEAFKAIIEKNEIDFAKTLLEA